MEKQRLEQLVVHGEELIYEGDLFIFGDLFLKDSTLIVEGNIFVKGFTTLQGSDLKCKKLSCSQIDATDSEIHVDYLCSLNINSDGDVYVANDAIAGKVKAMNYYVGRDNYSNEITTIQDVNILGNNSSRTINARDVYIEGNCLMHYFGIFCHSFRSGYIYDCTAITVK